MGARIENGTGHREGQWRAVDDEKQVRTPWQWSGASETVRRGAIFAVNRTDRLKLTSHRHSVDPEGWIIVHSI